MIPSTRWWPLPERLELPVPDRVRLPERRHERPDAAGGDRRRWPPRCAAAAELPRIGKAAIDTCSGCARRARAAAARALGAPEDEVALTSSTIAGDRPGLRRPRLVGGRRGRDDHRGASRPAGAAGRAQPALRRRRAGGAGARRDRGDRPRHDAWSPSRTSCGRPASCCRCPRSRPPRTRSARRCSSTAPSRAGRSRSTWRATGADFYAASGQKWLLGPQGTGALWVHPRQNDRLRPATPSYFTYADGHVGTAACRGGALRRRQPRHDRAGGLRGGDGVGRGPAGRAGGLACARGRAGGRGGPAPARRGPRRRRCTIPAGRAAA